GRRVEGRRVTRRLVEGDLTEEGRDALVAVLFVEEIQPRDGSRRVERDIQDLEASRRVTSPAVSEDIHAGSAGEGSRTVDHEHPLVERLSVGRIELEREVGGGRSAAHVDLE